MSRGIFCSNDMYLIVEFAHLGIISFVGSILYPFWIIIKSVHFLEWINHYALLPYQTWYVGFNHIIVHNIEE